MTKTKQERLEQLIQRYKDLVKITFKSDQESNELEQLEKEIETIKDLIHDDTYHTKQLAQVTQPWPDPQTYKKDQPETKKPTQDQLINEELRWKLKQLKDKQKLIDQKLKLHKLEEDIEKKTEKLKEMDQEDNYITSKPDKDGIITLEQAKYDKKMKLLQEKLDQTTGFIARSKVKSEISKLQSTKAHVKMVNGSIKLARGIKKVSGFIDDMSKGLNELSKFSGYNDKPNKKGKSNHDDFGFNNSVFKL